MTFGDTLRLGNVILAIDDHPHVDKDATPETDDPGVTGALEREQLSPAQTQVLKLLLKGLSEEEIAEHLFISIQTVHSHAKRIYRILGVHSRAQLLARYLSQKDGQELPQ